MAFGSSDKKNIKTKRISSSAILNRKKKNTLIQHFNFVKNFKNNISYYIFNNKAMLCDEDSKKELSSHFKQFKTPELYSWEVQKIFHQSIDFYSNWMDKLILNNKFILQKEFKITYYKRDVKSKSGEILAKKGDVKDTSFISKHSSLTRIMKILKLNTKGCFNIEYKIFKIYC